MTSITNFVVHIMFIYFQERHLQLFKYIIATLHITLKAIYIRLDYKLNIHPITYIIDIYIFIKFICTHLCSAILNAPTIYIYMYH